MTRRRFRTLIVIQALVTVAAMLATWFPQYSQALADAYAAEPLPYTASSVAMGYAMAVALPWLLAAMVALSLATTIGLFAFKRWARTLLLWMTVAGVLLMPFTGAVVYWGLESALWEASTLLWGALLAAAYWSPVHAAFGDVDAQARTLA